jgi:hypothetical protein
MSAPAAPSRSDEPATADAGPSAAWQADADARPIVMISVFKAGTHLMRRLLTDLTGRPHHEPPIVPGKVDYYDPGQLQFVPGRFYSWHLVPTEPIRRRLIAAAARPVLVLRNLFDLVVSMYHHFADNIDADSGRGRNVDHHFRAMDRDAGLEAIIVGLTRPDFRWRGIGPQAAHMVDLLALAEAHPSFVTSFERLTAHKRQEVQRLAAYLELSLSPARLDTIVGGSSFAAMRAQALAQGRGSHYREGQPGSHTRALTPRHIALVREQIAQHAPDLEARARAAGFGEILQTTG